MTNSQRPSEGSDIPAGPSPTSGGPVPARPSRFGHPTLPGDGSVPGDPEDSDHSHLLGGADRQGTPSSMPSPTHGPSARPPATDEDLDHQLGEWRALMAQRPGITPDDVEELEDHLLSEVHDLRAAGLSPEEAFLIGVRRLGSQDEVSREYSEVHSERLWRQLVLVPSTPSPAGSLPARWDLPAALGLGLLAGLAVRIPYSVLGDAASGDFYVRNIVFLVLPFLAIYLAARSGSRSRGGLAVVVGAFAASALLANLYPSHGPAQTHLLTALHLPIALVVVVGIAYLGGRWRSLEAWMDWVRFLGEAVIYYVLIALGGGVVTALVTQIFSAVGLDGIDTALGWVVPVCAAGAVLVCAWLVERKKSVMENMAPVLTAVFTPILTLALLSFLVVVVASGRLVDLDREVLISFDALLIVVAALVLFTVSARHPESPRRALDWMQLVLVLAALAVDVLMLWAMSGRLLEYGTSPNKLAALGCNLVLLAHLAGSAWHYLGILTSRRPSLDLERWQCLALPFFGAWAGVVALVFPPVFGFR